MADWTWTTADALVSQTWSKSWWIEARTSSYFYENGFVGPEYEDKIIVEFPDLEQNQGYQHTYGQIRELTGSGVSGDNDMEGQEEVPDSYDDQITLNQKRNAIRTKGKLSEQYKSDKATRKWAKVLLKRWMSGTIDQDLFTDLGASFTKSLWGGDATGTTDIEAGDYMTLQLISKAVTYARKATPKITGVTVMGKRYHVIVISPDQAFDLTERDAAWAQAQREAQRRGNDNPIFHQAMGVHKDVAIHQHERVAIATTWGATTNLAGASALFMGAGAGAIAYAKRKIWNEKTFDLIDRSITQECVLNNEVNSGKALVCADDYEMRKAA